MFFKILALFCVTIMISETAAFVKRDVSPSQPPNILDSFQRNMEQFKNCVDQSLAKAVGEVNEKQLQPVFNVIGDQVTRIQKAFDDLTLTKSSAGARD